MKTLQNNFTIPEQSKRLLELGVPDWTADCYIGRDNKVHVINGDIPKSLIYAVACVHCWSVGRLIEILRICSPTDAITCEFSEKTTVWRIVRWFENDDLDFSKLEE